MPLDVDQITAITLDVIRQHPKPLELVGIIPADGGSSRVELMVTITGCHDKPCRLLLNLSRGSSAALERELRGKLRELLGTHTAGP